MGGLNDVKLNYIESVGDVVAFAQWLGERRPCLAVDTETTGLEHRNGHVRLGQVGDAMTGWAIPWERYAGLVIDAIEKYDGPIVFHNAKFDIRFMEQRMSWAFPWSKAHDTMAISHLLDPRGAHGLKQLAAKHIDARAPAMQSQLDDAMASAKWTWATVPMDFGPYWQYAALDVVLTARLWEHLFPQLTEQERELYDIEMSALKVLSGMEDRGAAVDLAFVAEQRTKMLDYVSVVKDWCKDNHGISPSANAQLTRRLVELGAELTKTTATGNLSCDKEVLQLVGIQGPPAASQLAHAALTSRRYTKLVSTYLEHFMNEHVDGRIHCSIRPMGARTGRMSITGPPLQTLPRPDEDNPAAIAIRKCFVAREGHKLVMVDYDQVELRLAGHFSQDPTILEVLADQSLDPFTEFARRIYDDPNLVKKDPRRQLTKNASYAKLYGAGAEKFSMTAGVPVEQGRAFLQAFDKQFPGLLQFQRAVQRVALERLRSDGEPWVRTAFGRKLSCENGKEYKLVNYLIQGTAADLLKMKLVELDMAGLAEYAVLPVHDEVVFEFPADQAEELGREAAHVMTERQRLRVELPVGVDGPYDRWGQKYE